MLLKAYFCDTNRFNFRPLLTFTEFWDVLIDSDVYECSLEFRASASFEVYFQDPEMSRAHDFPLLTGHFLMASWIWVTKQMFYFCIPSKSARWLQMITLHEKLQVPEAACHAWSQGHPGG